jgi:rhodanese-related sulfurtransferase
MKPDNLKKLPIDKEIIIVCYVGHTASQVLVLLKLLGYNAKVLKYGMGTSPTIGVPVAGWSDFGYNVIH